MGDKIGKVADLNPLNPLDSDALFGKKQVDKADPVAADIKKLRRRGAKMQLESLDRYDPTAGISQSIERQKKMARGGVDDQRRKMQKLSAQRGLGNSSVGIGAILGAEERGQDKVRDIEAQRSGLEQSAIGQKIGLGSQLVAQGGPIRMKDRKYRKGGLAPILGAAAGGYFGGAQGAQAGYGAGQALQAGAS